jgi:hypothetical protein
MLVNVFLVLSLLFIANATGKADAERWYHRGAGELCAGRPASAMRAILTTHEERAVATV